MKKLITILTLLLISQVLRAQAPQATSYQAVIRNSSGSVLSNQLVKVRFSIRDSAANGTVVYQETQTPTTNAQGLINLFAGQGTAVTGTFAGINWGSKSKFLQTEIDITGGSNYTDMGTTQLMSVPYALYANAAANGNPNGTAVGEMLYWNGTSWVKINPGTNGQNLTFCNGVPQWGPCLILPTVLTGSITAKTAINATAGGNVTDSGSAKITARGMCFSTSINPTIANTKTASGTNTIGAFTVSLTGLSALTTYHYRAYATTSVGTSYGADSVFTTNAATIPALTTTAASAITGTTATSGGNITSDNGATITARGICWSTTTYPTISLTTKTVDGTGAGAFISSITGLTPNTTYYVRAYATNSAGTAYGTQVSFTTASAVANLPRVTIGTQVWTTQNLSVARYRNGDTIPQVTDPTQWANLTTGAWCWYNNDSSTFATTYGRLYNWYAVNDARGLAPQGYHIPSDAEWTILGTTLGGSIAGGSMKSITGWNSPNIGATNSSGFSGLPGGYRDSIGTSFLDVGNVGYWWSSSEGGTIYAWSRYLKYNDSYVYGTDFTKRLGFSVRCLRDTTITPSTPILTTTTLTSITTSTATSGGNITSDGGATITARGICWSTTANPTIALTTKTVDGTGAGTFTSSITSLASGNTYYVRAYATNSAGTAYGTQLSFSTLRLSSVNTGAITNITNNTATASGNVTDSGSRSITSRGVCYSTAPSPTITNGTVVASGTNTTGAFTVSLTGLLANTRYYVRAYVTTSLGSSYGVDTLFTTASAVANLPSVTIGTQVWSSKNLDVATYRNGDPIPQVTDSAQWATLTTGAWCWYNNDSATYAATYGRLYNWYAVNDARGLAPFGWHVPSDGEWNKLVKYLDPGADTTCQGCNQSTSAGGALKSVIGWTSPNTGATNSSGFSGLPGGSCNNIGAFIDVGYNVYWWSSTEIFTTNAQFRGLYFLHTNVVNSSENKRVGFSVRCVRD